jgi:hypothetical protein
MTVGFSDPLEYMIYIFERIGKFNAEFPERLSTTVMVNLQVWRSLQNDASGTNPLLRVWDHIRGRTRTRGPW